MNKVLTVQRGTYTATATHMACCNLDAASPFTLVTLHGMGETQSVWTPIAQHLASYFCQGYQLALPWHCEDGKLWGFDATPDKWLELLLERLPKGDKVVLAHSFGANALLELMNRRPLVDIRAIVMFSPYFKRHYDEFDWGLFRQYVVDFEKFLLCSLVFRPGADRLSAVSRALIVEKIKEKYSSFSWIQFFLLFSRTPGLRLREFDLPALIIGGKKDISVQPQDLHALASGLPDARLVLLPDCGHYSMLENSDEVIRIIESFITKIMEKKL